MEPPKSISYEVFELFNRVIDQANRIDRVLRSLEEKNKKYDEIVTQFELFASNVKSNLQTFIENTHFNIEKSINLYKKEHERLVQFFNENEKTKELYHQAQALYKELGDLKLSYENLTSQIAEAYQKFNKLIEGISEKSNKHLEKTLQELKDKIDAEIQRKVDRDLKNIETNILLKNKLLEGKVSELNSAVNTLYSILQLPEFQSLFSPENNKSNKEDDEGTMEAWEEAKKIDKLEQKHLNITSELELKLDQITEKFKDFETRLNKEKKEITKIYDSMLELNNDEYKQVRDKVHNLYLQIDRLQEDLAKSRSQTMIAIGISVLAIISAIIFSLVL